MGKTYNPPRWYEMEGFEGWGVPEEFHRWCDVSYHNDSAPSFAAIINGVRWRVWVDHVDPEQRELDGPRYMVMPTLYDDIRQEWYDDYDGPAAAGFGTLDEVRQHIGWVGTEIYFDRANNVYWMDVRYGAMPRERVHVHSLPPDEVATDEDDAAAMRDAQKNHRGLGPFYVFRGVED